MRTIQSLRRADHTLILGNMEWSLDQIVRVDRRSSFTFRRLEGKLFSEELRAGSFEGADNVGQVENPNCAFEDGVVVWRRGIGEVEVFHAPADSEEIGSCGGEACFERENGGSSFGNMGLQVGCFSRGEFGDEGRSEERFEAVKSGHRGRHDCMDSWTNKCRVDQEKKKVRVLPWPSSGRAPCEEA